MIPFFLSTKPCQDQRQKAGNRGGADQTELAYAQSWSLVYFLMQDERRDAFFNFIRVYRDGNPRRPPTDHAALLCSTLGSDAATFEADWRRFIARF